MRVFMCYCGRACVFLSVCVHVYVSMMVCVCFCVRASVQGCIGVFVCVGMRVHFPSRFWTRIATLFVLLGLHVSGGSVDDFLWPNNA